MRRNRRLTQVVLSLTAMAFLGGCGGGDDDKASPTTVATSPTTVPATTVSTAVGSLARLPEVFEPAAGYTYVAVSDSDLGDLEDQFADNPETKAAVVGLDARTVERKGDEVGAIIAIRFDKKSSALPGFADGFVAGVTGEADVSRTITVGGEEATAGTTSDDAHFVTWIKGDLALVVVAGDDPTALAVATVLINANK